MASAVAEVQKPVKAKDAKKAAAKIVQVEHNFAAVPSASTTPKKKSATDVSTGYKITLSVSINHQVSTSYMFRNEDVVAAAQKSAAGTPKAPKIKKVLSAPKLEEPVVVDAGMD